MLSMNEIMKEAGLLPPSEDASHSEKIQYHKGMLVHIELEVAFHYLMDILRAYDTDTIRLERIFLKESGRLHRDALSIVLPKRNLVLANLSDASPPVSYRWIDQDELMRHMDWQKPYFFTTSDTLESFFASMYLL